MSEVNLIGLTKPSAYTECSTANELVAWAAIDSMAAQAEFERKLP
jgi:hypothetical protein